MPDPIGEEHGQLKEHLSPVLNTPGPLTGDIHGGQVEHLSSAPSDGKCSCPSWLYGVDDGSSQSCSWCRWAYGFQLGTWRTSRVLPSCFATSEQWGDICCPMHFWISVFG